MSLVLLEVLVAVAVAAAAVVVIFSQDFLQLFPSHNRQWKYHGLDADCS